MSRTFANIFNLNGKINMVTKMYNNNLKFCWEELEMTQTELGYVFGVTKRTVSGWETAGDTMPLIKLIKFSNLYGYSLDYIVGFTRFNINYGNNAKCDK